PLVSPRPLPPGPSVRDALRARRFWALAIGMGCGALPLHFSLAHAVAHLTDVGFAPGTAAAMLGLGGAGAAAGMVLCGYLADRWNAEIVYSIGSLAFLLSLIVLARIAPGQVGLVYAYPVLLAIGFASRQSLTGVMTAALAAGRSLGAIMGVVAMCLAVGIALGPVLGGWLFDLAGSYQPAFLLAGAFAVLSTLCIWIAAPRRGSLLRPAGAVAPGAVPAHARPSAGPGAPPATIHR
ncbi:MAG TPA: MFS transporter, partial [Chloroflexota bacterium]|nr:MFS transporter [Chloroflexota bacterium]